MRMKLAGFVALGACALLLAACGGSGSEKAEDHGAAPADAAAPSMEDAAAAAAEAAGAPDAPPEAPVEETDTAPVTPGEAPPPPEPTKSENIFY